MLLSTASISQAARINAPLATDFSSTATEPHSASSMANNPYFAEDQAWLSRVERNVRKNMSNNHFTIVQLADAVMISERQLRRRLKKLMGLGPRQYLTRIRLEYALQMLTKKQYKTLAQIAHAVGYRDVDSFRAKFRKTYGISPMDYLR